jgi:hypothetical protein
MKRVTNWMNLSQLRRAVLAAPLERCEPEPLHLVEVPPQARVVTRDSEVVQMPFQHLLHPSPGFRRLPSFSMATCWTSRKYPAIGSCIVLRNSILIASSLARIRFLIVLRPMTNEPHLRDRVQKCVKPRKSKVSAFPSPSFSRCLAAWRPKRISRILSECNASSNLRSRSLRSSGTPVPRAHAESRRWCRPHMCSRAGKSPQSTTPDLQVGF